MLSLGLGTARVALLRSAQPPAESYPRGVSSPEPGLAVGSGWIWPQISSSATTRN